MLFILFHSNGLPKKHPGQRSCCIIIESA